MTTKHHFGAFQPHTLTKHAILDAYLKAWGTILVPNFKEAWFVDAFAGEGQDDQGNPGSPLIAARTAEQINRTFFPAGVGRGEGMRVIAFEADESRFASLKEVMRPFVGDPWYKGIGVIRRGALENTLSGVLQAIGESPALFFLDPFGIDGLSAAVLPELLKGAHNELLILFNDEGAVRLAGKVRAGSPDEAAAYANAESGIHNTLFGEEDTEAMRMVIRDRLKRSLAGHKSNVNAVRIMDTAFGGDWWRPIIDSTPEDQRQLKFVELYEQLLEKIGGTRLLRFSIDTPDGRHKYFLIHAAKDRRAYAVMKDAMHRARQKQMETYNHAPSFLQYLESGPSIKPVADAVCRHFAGRQVRWYGSSPCVKDYAIEQTPLWFHECDALKAELLHRGCTDVNEKGKPKRPLSFTFPR